MPGREREREGKRDRIISVLRKREKERKPTEEVNRSTPQFSLLLLVVLTLTLLFFNFNSACNCFLIIFFLLPRRSRNDVFTLYASLGFFPLPSLILGRAVSGGLLAVFQELLDCFANALVSRRAIWRDIETRDNLTC